MAQRALGTSARIALLVIALVAAVAVPLAAPERPAAVEILLVAAAVFAALGVRRAIPAGSTLPGRILVACGLLAVLTALVVALR